MKTIKLFLLVLLFCSVTNICSADDIIKDKLSIFTQLYVRHTYADPNLNEKNDIIGITYDRYTFFTFNNSFKKRSYFLGYDLVDKILCRKDKFLQINLHLYAGLLYGYGDSSFLSYEGHRLVAAPTFEFGLYKGLSVEVLHVPDLNLGTIISVIKYNF